MFADSIELARRDKSARHPWVHAWSSSAELLELEDPRHPDACIELLCLL